MKPLVVVLSIVCVALAAQVWFGQGPGNGAHQALAALSATVTSYSNEVREARSKADEEARLAAYLQSNLAAKISELTTVSNELTQTASALASAQTDLRVSQTEARNNSGRIAELAGQKGELQSKLDELAGSIKVLNTHIAEARRKLSAAEGDRESLTRELSKLQTDKAELLRQFNDLATLKAQVALLREETAVNQRLNWMAQGVYQTAGRKGAEALMTKSVAPALAGEPSLNVDVREKGLPAEEPAARILGR